MNESRVEQRLVHEVQARKGWALKFIPSVSGMPDRLILLPGGRMFFVELKRPKGGRVAAHQTVVHGKLAKLGFPVAILSSIDEVLEWLQLIDTAASGNA